VQQNMLNQVGGGQLKGGKEANRVFNKVAMLLKITPQKAQRILLHGPNLGNWDINAVSCFILLHPLFQMSVPID
jgi:hypothetical protein